jgi:hypothetical protein
VPENTNGLQGKRCLPHVSAVTRPLIVASIPTQHSQLRPGASGLLPCSAIPTLVQVVTDNTLSQTLLLGMILIKYQDVPAAGCFPGQGVYGPIYYSPEVCEECPEGTYAIGGALAPCQPCAINAFEFLSSAAGSTSIADCTCAKGEISRDTDSA